MNVSLLDCALVHHVTRDSKKAHRDVSSGCLLSGNFIYLKSEIPTKHIHAIGGWRILAAADCLTKFCGDAGHIAHAHRGIYSTDMNHPPTFQTVQPSVTVNRFGLIQF